MAFKMSFSGFGGISEAARELLKKAVGNEQETDSNPNTAGNFEDPPEAKAKALQGAFRKNKKY
jgi:hypothetical protein